MVQHTKSPADIERGIRVLKSDIEIGPVHHRQPKRLRALALVYSMALIVGRVMRMLRVNPNRSEQVSPGSTCAGHPQRVSKTP